MVPNIAKVGGLQIQGAEGEAIVGYCDPSATPELEPSVFPLRGKKDGEKPNRPWNAPPVYSRNQVWIGIRFKNHNDW